MRLIYELFPSAPVKRENLSPEINRNKNSVPHSYRHFSREISPNFHHQVAELPIVTLASTSTGSNKIRKSADNQLTSPRRRPPPFAAASLEMQYVIGFSSGGKLQDVIEGDDGLDFPSPLCSEGRSEHQLLAPLIGLLFW